MPGTKKRVFKNHKAQLIMKKLQEVQAEDRYGFKALLLQQLNAT